MDLMRGGQRGLHEMRNRLCEGGRVDRLVYCCSSVFERDRSSWWANEENLNTLEGVGLSLLTRCERGGNAGTRLGNGAALVKVFVLPATGAGANGMTSFIKKNQANE
jgi:hypothetical protein